MYPVQLNTLLGKELQMENTIESVATVATNVSKLDRVIKVATSPAGLIAAGVLAAGTGLYFLGRRKAKKEEAAIAASMAQLQAELNALRAAKAAKEEPAAK